MESSNHPAPTPAARPAVLVVDDERALLKTMEIALAGEFEVTTAATAAEAEMLLTTEPFAVVVCDHMLPGEAGLDFLVRMREVRPKTRRILLTGYMNPELISRSVAVAELSDCLLKPVEAKALVTAVRRAVAR